MDKNKKFKCNNQVKNNNSKMKKIKFHNNNKNKCKNKINNQNNFKKNRIMLKMLMIS